MLRKFAMFVTGIICFSFYACKKEVAPPPDNSHFLDHGSQSCVFYLTGQTWQVYASCDSVSGDTIVRNDRLRFYSTPDDAYVSWNNNSGGTEYLAYHIAPVFDDQHVVFCMHNTPFGNIIGVTPLDSISNHHISKIRFKGSNNVVTYLWMKRTR